MLIRRDLLKASLAGLAGSALLLKAMPAEASTTSNMILVVLDMSGGNDGLNTVVPLKSFGAYTQLRSPVPAPAGLAMNYTLAQLAATAFDANPATPAASASSYAFGPTMGAMRSLYAQGHLAVINGVGLPLAEIASLSHVDASRDWHTGHINTPDFVPPGWLALALQNAGAGQLGPTLSLSDSPVMLNGVAPYLVSPPPFDYFNFAYGPADSSAQIQSVFSAILNMSPSTATAGGIGATMLQAKTAVAAFQALAAAEPVADYPAVANTIDAQLRDVARLILGGSGIRGYYTKYYGFDTHAQQGTLQPQLIGDVANAMANFYTYIKAKAASANVVLVTISDFGRRANSNLDFGTDHGSSSSMFVLGDMVKGGVYGKYPPLTKFDANGNLLVTVDFRNVISDLLGAMGANPTSILGATYPKLGFI